MRMEVGNGDEFNLGEVLKVCGTAGTIPPHFGHWESIKKMLFRFKQHFARVSRDDNP